MMKWGGKKSSSSSSSSAFSWLSKLKHIRINSDSNHEKIKHKEKQISPPSCFDIGGKNGNKNGRRKSQSKLNLKEKDIIIGLEDETKMVNDENGDYDREKEYENMRRRFERKAQQVLEEQLLKLEKEAKEVEEKNALFFQDESPRTICTPRKTHSFGSSRLRNVRENHFEKSEIESSQRKKQSYDDEKESFLKQNEELKKIKIQEKQRRKIKKVSRVKIYSPRMVSKVEISRIKALEEMRNKAKQKMKKEEIMDEIISTNPELDSFAVIKCSLNPKQDFRDSMIEMIEEKQISKAEEMEELLACYLTLNADEYHDLIIKVFRQVWFDMSQYGFGVNSEMQLGCYE
ncbi:unnamed protein product [Trifolium pratense]|uniref:Uncharacterized protein n=1 Tax=Trifolium pratense TaxID=57577 RepID=A0ACB0KNI3_TRIPR|nr:unnamed protein product [Trifolium pratense]